MRVIDLIAFSLPLAACQSGELSSPEPQPNAMNGPGAAAPSAPAPAADVRAAGWKLESSGEGAALVLTSASGGPALRLLCPARGGNILVNVPAFRPVASEERLSFGSGGAVVALVADTRGDSGRGGVSGTGAVPGNLPALVAGPIAVNYGAQNSGPHPAPPPDLARGFVSACGDGAAASVSPCLMQGDERLRIAPLRAVGTEPFWGARIEGRCVTYSHIEDQSGTRVWTRYAASADGGTWTGALGGQRFELTTRAAPGCSDGMSDRRYPIAVELLVGGERRTGCAEPA